MVATIYELPFGKDKHWGSNWSGLPEALFGGWKMSAIFQVRSGFPITVQNSNRRSLQGTRSAEWPNCIGDPVPANRSITSDPNAPADSKWLNIAAFQVPALGTFGNCGIGITDAPGYTNVDASISKRFKAGHAIPELRPRLLTSESPELRTSGATQTAASPSDLTTRWLAPSDRVVASLLQILCWGDAASRTPTLARRRREPYFRRACSPRAAHGPDFARGQRARLARVEADRPLIVSCLEGSLFAPTGDAHEVKAKWLAVATSHEGPAGLPNAAT